MIRWTIRYKGEFVGFTFAPSANDAIAKYARLNEASTKGLTAARPVN